MKVTRYGTQMRTCVHVLYFSNHTKTVKATVWVRGYRGGDFRQRFRASVRNNSGTWYRSSFRAPSDLGGRSQAVARIAHHYGTTRGSGQANGLSQRRIGTDWRTQKSQYVTD